MGYFITAWISVSLGVVIGFITCALLTASKDSANESEET